MWLLSPLTTNTAPRPHVSRRLRCSYLTRRTRSSPVRQINPPSRFRMPHRNPRRRVTPRVHRHRLHRLPTPAHPRRPLPMVRLQAQRHSPLTVTHRQRMSHRGNIPRPTHRRDNRNMRHRGNLKLTRPRVKATRQPRLSPFIPPRVSRRIRVNRATLQHRDNKPIRDNRPIQLRRPPTRRARSRRRLTRHPSHPAR